MKPEKSFAAAIEQMAHFLRTEVKLKGRALPLSEASMPPSFLNSLNQIAKLIRSQLHPQKKPKKQKKRSWKKRPHS